MQVTNYLDSGAKIAIYDDIDEARESTADIIHDAGYIPIVINEPIVNFDDCVNHLAKFDGVLIDHRLSAGNYGEFNGAMVIRQLYSRKKPALLFTAWAVGDPEALQPYKRYLVNVVSKGEEDELEKIVNGFKICVDELNNIFIPERRPTRTIIVIANDYEGEENLNRVDAFVPSWNPNEGVTFPIEIIPEQFRSYLKEGQLFIADVNTGAESQHDLFYENFELAPDLD